MSEIHGATGSYVVNALDPNELDEFEAHLAVCPTCSREVVEFCETAAELSLLAAAPPPPPALREAVLSGISEVRQLPPLPGNPRRAAPEPEGPGPEEPDDEPEVEPAPLPPAAGLARDVQVERIDELALRRTSRRAKVLSVLVAAVTVVALALGGVVYSLARQDQAPVAAASQVDPSLLAAPDARIYSVTVGGAPASFVVSKGQNRAAFVSSDLPSPGPGNVYHLWTLKGKDVSQPDIVRPDNTLNGGSQGTQMFSGPVSDSDALAVNIEPAGTSPTVPTTDVLAVAQI